MSDNNTIGSFNLDEIAKQQGLDVHIKSTRNENPKDADLRRFKEKWLFIATLVLIVISFIGWGWFIVFHPESPHLGIVLNGGFGLLMALIGYYVKK